LDWYGSYPGTVSDPKGATTGSYRVLRGGSWYYSSAAVCRVGFRYSDHSPDRADLYIGFRAALPSAEPTLDDMALIPAGSFTMGDCMGDGHSDELPLHSVYVSAFYMDRYLVTNEKMRQVLQWAYDQDL